MNNISSFEKLKEYNTILNSLEKDLKEVRKLLPSTSKVENICKIFNYFLNYYIGIEKYSLVEDQGVIKLKMLKEDISEATELLSDGEKHMIGLSYYLANSIKIFDDIDKFRDAKFVIDDPVTSVSYIYFFGICSLLKDFTRYLGKEILKDTNTDSMDNIQKIILTHNTQLFYMLSSHTFRNNIEIFLLDQKKLKKITSKNLMSEMKMSLLRIYEYSKDKANKPVPGNDFRRFFETMKYFYGIEGDFNAENLKEIFYELDRNFQNKTASQRRIFYTMIQYFSHGNPEALFEHIDQGCIEVFTDDFVNVIEDSQFKGLWSEVKKLSDI